MGELDALAAIDKDLAVFKEQVNAKFQIIQVQLLWIVRLAGAQLLCLILILGGEKGIKVLQALKALW